MATSKAKQKGAQAKTEVKGPRKDTMVFPNLVNNVHEVRITGADKGLVATLSFERIVVGWNGEEKSCDKSLIIVSISKPVGERDKVVKKFIIGVKQDNNMMWLGDAKLEAERAEVESV
jgi:hypothetical protein